ncbi:TolC family protein [Sphingomonas rhizophila]|uniref:TolC family protein n=1 Tax=Sphingomonas rhizophila TaxID=2071607 RepID=A0A7G9SBR3_9SPHN|nr:TolC family protein [Sphingomonas rhizophila]QNN65288.1 TolC family protein [Sphingomonas rhizophila]
MKPTILMTAASSLALVACAAGPDYVAPPQTASAAAPFVAAVGPAVDPSRPAEGQWWRLYDDPVLDGLVTDALNHNTDVREAVARLDKARALLRAQKTERLPDVGASAGASYARAPADQVAPGDDRTGARFDAGLTASYEVDLFGRIGRGIEAAGGDLAAADADLGAVRIAVAAETARAYADAAGAAAQIQIAQKIVDLLAGSERVAGRRAEVGLTTDLDTARIAALRHERAAQIPQLMAQREAALFRLALLTGRPPRELPAAAGDRSAALSLDRPIPVGDGAQLIARRPDVRAAERRLAASTARIGVATAELYPRISLGGSASSTAGSLGNLFSGGPIGWLLGPLISWSFQDHALARARVAGAEADTRGALAAFDGAVLRSLQETETALSAYRRTIERRRDLAQANDAAARAARIVRAQQREGTVDALSLFDAERTYAERQAALSAVEADLADRQIDLFKALGGTW